MAFGERMTKYTGWAKDSEQYRKMIDILETFYECVKDQVKAEYLSKYDSSHTNPCPYEYYEIKDEYPGNTCSTKSNFFVVEEVTKEEETLPWKEAFIRYTDIQYNTIPRMSLKQWLNMWGRLCYGAAGISDFPIWVQLLPELFFDVGDRDGRLIKIWKI